MTYVQTYNEITFEWMKGATVNPYLDSWKLEVNKSKPFLNDMQRYFASVFSKKVPTIPQEGIDY